MTKQNIKEMLISMSTTENKDKVDKLLDKINLATEEQLQEKLNQIGNTEESIRNYFQKELSIRGNNENVEHKPINEIFTYGVAGSSIHLHMPVLLENIKQVTGITNVKGTRAAFDIINLYLLDAIEKVRNMKNDGFEEFLDKDCIYMISPILFGTGNKFLEKLDFETHEYKKKELKDREFVSENPEAQLAVSIFGDAANVGTAKIGFDVMDQLKWQDKVKEKIQEFAKKGIEIPKKEGLSFRESLSNLTESEIIEKSNPTDCSRQKEIEDKIP